jgi:retron-type reverse transcriptase
VDETDDGFPPIPNSNCGPVQFAQTVATVQDRVVQTAMKLVLEPIFEADFHPCSYGYRPQRDAKMASTVIRNELYRGAWGVVEIDFRSYFTTIPHDKLIILIKQRVVDGSMWLLRHCNGETHSNR